MNAPRANSYQVGGTHYKTDYEHWDLIIDAGLGPAYLVGVATKYIARWRKAAGLKDLQKSLHYIDKLLEWMGQYWNPDDYERDGEQHIELCNHIERFADANELSEVEQRVVYLLLTYETKEEVEQARLIVTGLIASAEVKQSEGKSALAEGGVPVEDSNRHAPRA